MSDHLSCTSARRIKPRQAEAYVLINQGKKTAVASTLRAKKIFFMLHNANVPEELILVSKHKAAHTQNLGVVSTVVYDALNLEVHTFGLQSGLENFHRFSKFLFSLVWILCMLSGVHACYTQGGNVQCLNGAKCSRQKRIYFVGICECY